MRNKLLLVVLFLSVLIPCLFGERITYSLNDHWLFTQNDDTHYALESIDVKHWKSVDLPHTWNNVDAADEIDGYYRGACWYRKYVTIPTILENRQLFIKFEGANQITSLFVNGREVGTHKGGYTGFVFDITPYIKVGEKNLLAVRVDNSHQLDIPPLSADFTFFGGIYRDVYLLATDKIHISVNDYASSGVYIQTPQVSKSQALVEIKTMLTNSSLDNRNLLVKHSITDAEGKQVKLLTEKIRLLKRMDRQPLVSKVEIQNPHLWSTTDPYLYRVFTQLYDAQSGLLLDEMVTPIGLRFFTFDPDKGFFLNGEHLKLIGTNRHQCFYQKGNAIADDYHIRDVLLLKEMGGNFLRVAHYPQDPTILQMCDKLGIVASVEIPIVNEITPSQPFEDNSLEMTREMIRQSYNHPSVIIWAYMNEVLLKLPCKKEDPALVPYGKAVRDLASNIEACIRQEDPSRYTMIPFHGNLELYQSVGLGDIAQIIGWNLYQGWYGGPFSGFDDFVDHAHNVFPTKSMIITEYGADSDPRLHSFNSQRFDFTIEYATLYHQHYQKKIRETPFIAGSNIWNLNDFYSEGRGDAVPRVNNKGITGLDREIKDAYLLYKAILSPIPQVLIGSTHWKNRAGVMNQSGVAMQPIEIFSNQPKVEIIHNGQSVGDFDVVDYKATVLIAFISGENTIEAIAGQHKDFCKIMFKGVPSVLTSSLTNEPFNLNVMMGTNRYFEDRNAAFSWIPEQPYMPGGWGYIAGEPYSVRTRHGQLPAAEIDVVGSDLDPIYQTQRVGIEAFRADVPKGQYAIYLHWCELESDLEKETLVYNLGGTAIREKIQERVFDVVINQSKVFTSLDLSKENGPERAVVRKAIVDVNDEKGLQIEFIPIKGKTILNAIQIVKIY